MQQDQRARVAEEREDCNAKLAAVEQVAQTEHRRQTSAEAHAREVERCQSVHTDGPEPGWDAGLNCTKRTNRREGGWA